MSEATKEKSVLEKLFLNLSCVYWGTMTIRD